MIYVVCKIVKIFEQGDFVLVFLFRHDTIIRIRECGDNKLPRSPRHIPTFQHVTHFQSSDWRSPNDRTCNRRTSYKLHQPAQGSVVADSPRSTIAPEANDGQHKRGGSEAGPDEISPRSTLNAGPDLLAIGILQF